MRKPEQAPEPSIEEILASIRRIIADDGPAVVAAEPEEEPAAMPGVGERRGRPYQSRSRGEPRTEDEVLELTEDFMLAEEAPAVALQEPEEPAEVMVNGTYGDRFGARAYHDPYDDTAASAAPAPSSPTFPAPAAAAAPAEASQVKTGEGDQPSHGIANVMAEVQRIVEGGAAAEKPGPAETSSGGWGKPDVEALNPGSAPRQAASRWSARQQVSEAPKPPVQETPPTSGRFLRHDPALSRNAGAPRQPAFGSRDSWSRGVQMPVPDEGPAMPFGRDDGEEIAEPAASAQSASASPEMTQSPAKQAQSQSPEAGNPAQPGFQMHAERLAERAVKDFASDRLGAEPPVADFLKSDRPLMEAITNTLADALTRSVSESEAAEDAAPPLEDLGDDTPPVEAQAETSGTTAAEAFNIPKPVNMEGGFVAPKPSVSPQAGPVAAEPETPELPREEPEDLAPAFRPRHAGSPYRPTGIVESPVMPQIPAAPGQMTARPASGFGASREMGIERLQASSAPKTLEDTVREMLRPLLVQWLNENMPRIINDALREELASAGLMPRIDDRRA